MVCYNGTMYITLPSVPGVIFYVTHPENIIDEYYQVSDSGNTLENRKGYIVGHRVTRQRTANVLT